MKLRIREDLPLTQAYQWPNPPCRRAKELPSAKYERIQQQLDNDKRRWFNAMIWAQTTGKK